MPLGPITNLNLGSRFTSKGETIIEAVTSSKVWICPQGVKEVTVILVGGGGAGGGIINRYYASNYVYNDGGGKYAGGAGGGQVVISTVAVSANQTYTIIVGAGGATTDSYSGDAQVPYGGSGNYSAFSYKPLSSVMLTSVPSLTSNNYNINAVFANGGGAGAGWSDPLSSFDFPTANLYLSYFPGVDGGNGGAPPQWEATDDLGTFYLGHPFNPDKGYKSGFYGGGGAGGEGVSLAAGGGGPPARIYPKTRTGRVPTVLYNTTLSAISPLVLAPGGGSGVGYQYTTYRLYGGGTDLLGSLGGNGGYWTFAASVWTFHTPTAGNANTGAGGGGAASRYGTNVTFSSEPGGNGGSGIVYLIYDRTLLKS